MAPYQKSITLDELKTDSNIEKKIEECFEFAKSQIPDYLLHSLDYGRFIFAIVINPQFILKIGHRLQSNSSCFNGWVHVFGDTKQDEEIFNRSGYFNGLRDIISEATGSIPLEEEQFHDELPGYWFISKKELGVKEVVNLVRKYESLNFVKEMAVYLSY